MTTDSMKMTVSHDTMVGKVVSWHLVASHGEIPWRSSGNSMTVHPWYPGSIMAGP